MLLTRVQFASISEPLQLKTNTDTHVKHLQQICKYMSSQIHVALCLQTIIKVVYKFQFS